MVVDIEPLAISAVPDTGLLGLRGAGPALAVDVLCQADVGDAGGVLPDDMHVGVQDGRVDGLAVLRQYWQDMQNHRVHFTTQNSVPHSPTSSIFYSPFTGFWNTTKIGPTIFQEKSKQFLPLSPVVLFRNCTLTARNPLAP